MSADTYTCGRRMSDLGPWKREEGLDGWRDRDGVRACTFCGSMHPEDFFAAIDRGLKIVPTDKSYKLYVDNYPDPRAGQQRVVSAITFDPSPEEIAQRGWVKVGRKERRHLKRDGWGASDYKWVMYTTRDTLHLKFYFQHLDTEGQERFIALHNEGEINFGYPGHLYTRPYFVRWKSDAPV